MSHRLRRGLVFLAFCLGLAAALPLLGRAADDAPAGRKYALLVGVKNYDKDQLRSLRFTEDDVNGLAAVLKDADYKRVVLMTQAEAVERRRQHAWSRRPRTSARSWRRSSTTASRTTRC